MNRIANLTLSTLYALTVIATAIGEWKYYVLGSSIEVGLLAASAHYALDLAGRDFRGNVSAPRAASE
jgi:hypothetical protein